MSTTTLSPSKEQELANKILQRAELAHMSRQLKLRLSKVGHQKVSPVKRRFSGEIKNQSPAKKPTLDSSPPSTPPRHQSDDDISTSRTIAQYSNPTTPQHARPSTPKNDDGAADLLMFLATSPMQLPKTPQISKSLQAQHSTFKVPQNLTMTPKTQQGGFKTPIFNMGDYVHNLFSPSPRVKDSSSPGRFKF